MKRILEKQGKHNAAFHENPQGFETKTSLGLDIPDGEFHENPQGFETCSSFDEYTRHS